MATKTVKAAKAAKAATKAAEVKTAEVKAAEVKPVEVVEAPKAEAEVKEEVKAEAEVKKAPAKKAAAKKTPAKKAEVKEEAKVETVISVQFQGMEVSVASVEDRVKAQFEAEGNKVSAIKTLNIYVKPEENSAYYVINDDVTGRVDLF